ALEQGVWEDLVRHLGASNDRRDDVFAAEAELRDLRDRAARTRGEVRLQVKLRKELGPCLFNVRREHFAADGVLVCVGKSVEVCCWRERGDPLDVEFWSVGFGNLAGPERPLTSLRMSP